MRNKKYKPIQVPAETHAIIKSYCDEYGFKIGGFIRMIVEKDGNQTMEIIRKDYWLKLKVDTAVSTLVFDLN